MNVYQKINEVKKVVKAFTKDKETTGAGSYSYASGSQILGAIKDKMEEIGLLFLPIETEHRNYEIFNYKNSFGKDKTDFLVNGKLIYEWINIDEPSDRQKVSFDYYGQQGDLSKAFGSALTYSERYLLLKSFGAPTDEDDPDARTEDKLSKDKSKAPAKPSTSPSNGAGKSKFTEVNELVKDTSISLASVNEWVKKKFKKFIKLNDLTNDQFDELMSSLKAKLGGDEA